MKEYFTPDQAAKQLQVSKSTVLKWLRSGKLNGAKLGHRTWRIGPEALEAFLDGEMDLEPLSKRDWAAIREGIAAIQRGEYITLDEYKRKRGFLLTPSSCLLPRKKECAAWTEPRRLAG